MPQIVPFYFVGQAVAVFASLGLLTYIFSIYLLPQMVQLFVTRSYITKLL